MINHYLKNLLDKNSQANSIVEPRLKSRFEDRNAQSYDDESTSNYETTRPVVQKAQPNVESSLEEEKMDLQHNVQKMDYMETIININHERQTKLLNQTENHFPSLEYKNAENIEKVVQKIPSESSDVRKDPLAKFKPNSINAIEKIESKTFGLLNKPVKTATNEKRYDGNGIDIGKENGINTVEQPSIKISIGRVEVKAVKASHKVPNKPKTKPNLKMSLEDFINKRK